MEESSLRAGLEDGSDAYMNTMKEDLPGWHAMMAGVLFTFVSI